MAKSKPIDVDREDAVTLAAGEPVKAAAVTQLGATFAERAAAAKKADSKAVGGEDAENKAVKSSESKSRRRSAK